MNYYKRHLGDYAKDAGHLSLLEHGVFTLLLDRYYSAEHPLSHDEALRVCRARTSDEKAAVDYVLGQFFTLDADGYRNKRADAEIAAYNEKSERNRVIGSRGGRPRKSGNPEETQTVSTNNPDGSVSVSEKNPSHKPLAISHKEASKATPYSSADAACPHAEIVALYHEILPACPRMKVWDGTRQSNLRARWREDAKRQDLDYWRRFFAHVAASPFLTGQVAAGDRKPFFASLDWLVKPENFAKVIEGRYHDRSNA